MTCPVCKGAVSPRDENETFPFCSSRCRLVDLGKWIDGDYRIPGPPSDVEDGRDDDDQFPQGK